jgi:hypothetical protein
MLNYIPHFKPVHRPVIYAAVLHTFEEILVFSEMEEKQRKREEREGELEVIKYVRHGIRKEETQREEKEKTY